MEVLNISKTNGKTLNGLKKVKIKQIDNLLEKYTMENLKTDVKQIQHS